MSNLEAADKLWWTYAQVGRDRERAGQSDEALDAYRKCLAIAEKYLATDPGNVEWQGNLGRSHFKIGKMMLLAGRQDEARASFRTSLPIVERLAAADPDNVEWQKDLINNLITSASVSDNDEAHFNRGLDIISRLNAEGKLSDLELEHYTNALKQAFNLE